MPLFFCVAGLFLIPQDRRSPGKVATHQIVRLGYPYLVWASLQMLLQIALSRYTNTPAHFSDLWRLTCAPPMQFWFLYALLLQVLAACLLMHLGVGRGGILALACALLITEPYVSLGSWGLLYQARSAFVFTALGIWLGTRPRLAALERIPRPACASLAALGFVVVAGHALWSTEPGRLQAFAIACTGIAATFALASCWPCPTASSTARVLASWGRASLAIFVAHTIASASVRIVLQKLLRVDNPGVHVVLGIAAGMAAPLALWSASRRLSLPFLFEWRPLPRRVPVIAIERP
jgi:fucose 4-O-acetylase-like acetyltransferase